MSRMLASFNSSLTADTALSKRSFFVTEDVPISDDQQDTTSTAPDTIEKAMRYMDKKYNTKFHAWVRNEANICHTCNYMHPVIAEFERGPPHVVHRAVKWLTEGWSVAGTAELIIKLFFHWGIGSEKFSNLVTEVTRSWAVQPYMADLVSTLVVAEDVGQVARFIKHFTNDWEVQPVVDLVSTIASALKWDGKYYKDFILSFVALERGHKRMTAEEIRQKFELRKQRLRNFKVDSRSGMSGNEFCSTIFGMCVLEVHEIRYLQKLESARKALDSTTIPFQESEARDSEGRFSPSPFSLSMSSFSDESGLDPDTNFKQTLTASSSSSTLVEESSLLPTSTTWDSLASLETVEAIIAHSRFLLEEHRLETRRQAVLLQIFEQCALSSSALERVSRVVGATDSFGQREE